MKQIRNNLYLGDMMEASDLILLKSHNITTILTVTFDNIKAHHPQNIKRIQVGLEDALSNKPVMISLAVGILNTLLLNKETVFVHCAAGLSRSPFIIAKYLSEAENRPLLECCDELKEINPEIHLDMWLKDEYASVLK